MRMWMVPAKLMCRAHLQGEYRELFTFLGTFRLKRNVDGYIEHNCLEPLAIPERYVELRDEMLARGYKPQKLFEYTPELISYLPKCYVDFKIDKKKSRELLMGRCPNCKERERQYGE